MEPTLCYYVRPFDHEISIASGTVWYATWTSEGAPTWSQVRPSLQPGMDGACVLELEAPLQGEAPLGGGAKDIPPPPWLLEVSFTDYDSFKEVVEIWSQSPRRI